MSTSLTPKELTEEINFFRDYCGWSDKRIEKHLGLKDGTMGQRRRREAKRTARKQLSNISVDVAA